MHKNVSDQTGLPWCFTDKQFTAWGGLRSFEEMLRRLGWNQAVAKSPLPRPRSNRGIDPCLMVQAFLVTIWTGGGRFAHTAMVRFDAALRTMFGLTHVASVSTFTRFFRRFGQKQVQEVFSSLFGWFWERIGRGNWTVDLDSTVLTRYGSQEGSELGYNPRNRGKKCHHPLIAFVSECRLVITAWLRPGNTNDASNVENFLREVLSVLGKRHSIGLLRCDGGFCIGSFFDLLEAQEIQYIVPARMLSTLRRQIAGLQNWVQVSGTQAVSEFMYQGQGWSKARRVVVVRHRIKDKREGRLLIEVPGYTYSVYVTSLTLPAIQVRELYQGRADSENRIKELFEDFAISGFATEKFWATEAAFRMACCAYNLMAMFRQALLGAASKQTLSTLRAQCFAIGASLGKEGHLAVLRIGLPRVRRPWFTGLFDQANKIGACSTLSFKSG